MKLVSELYQMLQYFYDRQTDRQTDRQQIKTRQNTEIKIIF